MNFSSIPFISRLIEFPSILEEQSLVARKRNSSHRCNSIVVKALSLPLVTVRVLTLPVLLLLMTLFTPVFTHILSVIFTGADAGSLANAAGPATKRVTLQAPSSTAGRRTSKQAAEQAVEKPFDGNARAKAGRTDRSKTVAVTGAAKQASTRAQGKASAKSLKRASANATAVKDGSSKSPAQARSVRVSAKARKQAVASARREALQQRRADAQRVETERAENQGATDDAADAPIGDRPLIDPSKPSDGLLAIETDNERREERKLGEDAKRAAAPVVPSGAAPTASTISKLPTGSSFAGAVAVPLQRSASFHSLPAGTIGSNETTFQAPGVVASQAVGDQPVSDRAVPVRALSEPLVATPAVQAGVRQPVALRSAGERSAVPPILDGLTALRSVDSSGSVAVDQQGNRVYLTVDPDLQLQARALLQRYKLPWGALVAVEPRTGRVLAMASYSEQEPFGQDVATRATFPAASLFKLVTAAAAIEQAGLDGDHTIFYRGGDYVLGKQNALPDVKRDRRKISFAEALGRSVNPAFARIGVGSLSDEILERYAKSFGFNQPLPFDSPIDVSHFERPDGEFETARTAAGFGAVTLSPLHAAVLTATIANRGLMMKPMIIDHIVGVDGQLKYQARPTPIRTAILGSTANELLQMMQATVDVGTGRRAFVKVRNPFLRSAPIAAKTGTLSGTNPRGLYHWFVAAVPANKPEIAISALIIDPGNVRVRCSELAREFLEYYFRDHADTLQTRSDPAQEKATS